MKVSMKFKKKKNTQLVQSICAVEFSFCLYLEFNSTNRKIIFSKNEYIHLNILLPHREYFTFWGFFSFQTPTRHTPLLMWFEHFSSQNDLLKRINKNTLKELLAQVSRFSFIYIYTGFHTETVPLFGIQHRDFTIWWI